MFFFFDSNITITLHFLPFGFFFIAFVTFLFYSCAFFFWPPTSFSFFSFLFFFFYISLLLTCGELKVSFYFSTSPFSFSTSPFSYIGRSSGTIISFVFTNLAFSTYWTQGSSSFVLFSLGLGLMKPNLFYLFFGNKFFFFL